MGWKSATPAFALVLCVMPFAASPTAAQTYGFVSFGNAAYSGEDDDPFCLGPTAFLTTINAGVSAPLVGFSVAFNNGDYPWPPPPPPGGQGEVFLTHGNTFQFMVELNPAHLVVAHLSEYVRPFIGVGLSISGDGETRPDTGDGPTHSVNGQTRPFLAYGLNGILPLGNRFGITAGYRGTSVFFGDFEIETPGGSTLSSDGKTLNSRSWSLGFTVRLGS